MRYSDPDPGFGALTCSRLRLIGNHRIVGRLFAVVSRLQVGAPGLGFANLPARKRCGDWQDKSPFEKPTRCDYVHAKTLC